MADLKISQLTALTAIDAATTDVLAVVDTSATTTKKISLADVAEFVAGSDAIVGALASVEPDFSSDQAILAGAVFIS
jgi:hypothetical protein